MGVTDSVNSFLYYYPRDVSDEEVVVIVSKKRNALIKGNKYSALDGS